jgi:hypothetical protein
MDCGVEGDRAVLHELHVKLVRFQYSPTSLEVKDSLELVAYMQIVLKNDWTAKSNSFLERGCGLTPSDKIELTM